MADVIHINSLDLARARADFFDGLGLDAKRPTAWTQYGYPEVVDFPLLKRAYERGGAGQGAVHRLLEKCWQQIPRIKQKKSDEVSPWEKKVTDLIDSIDGWQKLRDLDRRNMVGRFSALIYRVADGQLLSEPLVKGSKLVDLVPLFEDQIKVTEWHSDKADPDNYGKPRMFQFRTRSPSANNDHQGQPEDWADVHPSRVQILAEGSVGDNFFDGVPLLQAGINHLIDLEKIAGGSAEGFLKNSARTLVFSYKPEASVQAITQNADGTQSTKTVREIHEEQTRNLNKNQDSSIVIQGGEASALQTRVADPEPSFGVAANLFAASVRIPFTILFGQQTGRLASDQDQEDWNARCASRQVNELTPMLKQLVRRMQAVGLIEAGDFTVEWPPLGEPKEADKLANAQSMATTNKTAFDGGSTEPVFDIDEIRRVAGFEQRESGGDQFKEETPPEPLPTDPKAKPVPAVK